MTPSQEEYRTVPLTKGQVALVDAADFERIASVRWYARLDHHTGKFYAERYTYSVGTKRRILFMHREVLRMPLGDKSSVDHVNRDSLDNRRGNLRMATTRQNQANSRLLQRNNTSGYRGVVSSGNRWGAKIEANCVKQWLGTFPTKEGAAKAYDRAALAHFGEFATLNYPKEPAEQPAQPSAEKAGQ